MTAKELTAYEAQQQDLSLCGSLANMRRMVEENTDQALWHTAWNITLRQTGETIGLLAFQGAPADQTVELVFEVLAAYRGNGYAQEAISSLTDWALGRDSVYFVRVFTDEASEDCNHILKKLEFYRIESPVQGKQCWELERTQTAWISVYLSIGLALGLALGSGVFGNQMTGMTVGMSAGLALGAYMDAQDRKARKREQEPIKLDEPQPEKEKTKRRK